MAKIAYIGLGVMGSAMARHLAKAGHDMVAFNRTTDKTRAWIAANGGERAETPAQAAQGADAVITCVGADDDLAEVTIGEQGAFAAMKKGAIFIDHTTVSAEISRTLAAKATMLGFECVDAPVTGGQAGAENGALTIMCGGTEAAINAATPFMQAYAKSITHMGAPGSGQLAKMVNQICITGVMASMAEGIRFAQAAGLDTTKVYDSISGGAASSWQMVNRWPTMVKDEFDFGFAIDWMRKDLGLALAEARRNGATLPITSLVDQFYAEVQAMGGGRQDTSALIRRIGPAK